MDREIPLHIRRKENRKRIVRYSIVVLSITLVIIGLISFFKGSLSSKNLAVGKVSRGTLEITVNASGKVIPLVEEIIVSPISSKILEVYKNPGDMLEIGDAILKLDITSLETGYKQKLDEREMKKSRLLQMQVNLENNLSELQMQLSVKEMHLKQLETEFKNEKYLDSIGASTSDKVRQISLTYEVAKLEFQQLKQKIENQKANASAELKVQRLDLSIFEKSLAESERLLQDARILSPQRATLTSVNSDIGSPVGVGTQIATISDLTRFKVIAEIAGGYADKLSPGAKVIVKSGQMELEGTAVNIIPSVQNGIISFTVVLKEPGNPKLRSGLKTDVYVTYGIKDDVLRIPNSAYYIGKGLYDLWVIKGDKAVKRKVNLGESSFDYVEVISGLEHGEEVIISDMNPYKHRENVKIKNYWKL